MKIRRLVLIALAAIALLGAVAPFLNVNFCRAPIEAALERALNRKVTIGTIRFNLFTGPGFTLKEVTIAEDPSIGIEPFAYVETLEARIRLTSLFTRKLSFSNLRMKDTTVNLAKGASGAWNFQLLLERARTVGAQDLPSMQVRSGRINFKFGDDKAVFYFSDADIDIDAVDHNQFDVRFAGQPSRTDRAAQNFGQLLARGTWTRPVSGEAELDLTAELDRSAISQVAKLFEGGSAFGLHGIIASRAHISGPISNLKITGELRLDDMHRWDLSPPHSGGVRLNYSGVLDLSAHTLELATTAKDNPEFPVRIRFRATDYLSNPHWGTAVELRGVPVATFLEFARHMGAPLPEGVTVDGKLDGVIAYSQPGGLQGRLGVSDSSVKLPEAQPVRLKQADIILDSTGIRVGPATLEMDEGQTAELDAAYIPATGAADMKLTTRGMSVAELHTGTGRLLGAGAVPILESCKQGNWRGWIRYQNGKSDDDSGWSGEFEILNARLEPEGLAEPLRVTAAEVKVRGEQFVLTRLQASTGGLKVRGEFRHEPGTLRPDRLKLDIPTASIDGLQKIFAPTLRRSAGLLARMRLRTPPPPDWLKSRKVEANITVDQLNAGGEDWAFRARLTWDGVSVRLTSVEATHQDESVTGQLVVDLTSTNARFHAVGKIADLDYKGGRLSLDGAIDWRGAGLDALVNARASGTFAGEDIGFPPDAEFKTISGTLELAPGGQLKLLNIQAAQGFDVYIGQGSTQADGRLLLELSSGRRQVRLAGTLFGPPTPVVGR